MHRQPFALYRPRPWSRIPFVRVALVGFSVSTLGAWYLPRRRIYADAPDDQLGDDGGDTSFPPVDALFAYVRDTAAGYGFIQGNTGISRFDYMTIPNTMPVSFTNSVSSISLMPGTTWTMFAMFQGYNGWECAEAVSSRLLKDTMEALTELASRYIPFSSEHTEIGTGMAPVNEPNSEPYSEAVNRVIKKTFLDIDYGIIHQPLNLALGSAHPSQFTVSKVLGAALSGSSALLSFYDQESRELKIALTGDSRAVLGRRHTNTRNGNTSYEVHILTADQIRHNPVEQAQTRTLHPGEHISSDRYHHTLGPCGVSRAFGLAPYKWSHALQERLRKEFLADDIVVPHVDLKLAQPYLTAEPEITAIQVEPGDFLVMGSPGLWKSLTSEEVVGLVGLWIDRGMNVVKFNPDNPDAGPIQAKPARMSGGRVFRPDDLPVLLKRDDTEMYQQWRAQKRFLCVDKNVAAHLARNALGGADEDLMRALLVIDPPRASKFREEINVTVVFFDG